MLDLPVSIRKQELPNQVMCVVCLELGGEEAQDLGHKERPVS